MKLLKKDLNNTASIMKAFVDEHGNDIHEALPLRYPHELLIRYSTIVQPAPADDKLTNC
jgi:hypothetical protein